jgi:hypothetical protein
MEYIKIIFTVGLDCEAYQEVSGGNVVRYCDLDGNTLMLPSVTESRVIDPSPARPSWAIDAPLEGAP